MKKIIGLIVAVVVIWVVLKMMGIGVSVSPSDKLKEGEERTGESIAMMLARSSHEDIIGFALPETASHINDYKWPESELADFKTGQMMPAVLYGVVAELPQAEFDLWVSEHDLRKTPNLLESWPDILHCQVDGFRQWDLKRKAIGDIYFDESAKYEEYIACTHTDGKVYIKKVVRYVDGQDENKKWYYEKIPRTR